VKYKGWERQTRREAISFPTGGVKAENKTKNTPQRGRDVKMTLEAEANPKRWCCGGKCFWKGKGQKHMGNVSVGGEERLNRGGGSGEETAIK